MPAQVGDRFRLESYVPEELKKEVGRVVEAGKIREGRYTESQAIERMVRIALPKLQKEFGLRHAPQGVHA